LPRIIKVPVVGGGDCNKRQDLTPISFYVHILLYIASWPSRRVITIIHNIFTIHFGKYTSKTDSEREWGEGERK
jgi:hypothetical protein